MDLNLDSEEVKVSQVECHQELNQTETPPLILEAHLEELEIKFDFKNLNNKFN
jgi:hypothetical protein